MRDVFSDWIRDVMRPTKGELRRANWPVDPNVMDKVAAAFRPSKYEQRSLVRRLRLMDVALPQEVPAPHVTGVRRSLGHPRQAAIKSPVPIRVDGEHEAAVFARPAIAGAGLLAVAAAAAIAVLAQGDAGPPLEVGQTTTLTAKDVIALNSAITLIGPGDLTLTHLDADGATLVLNDGRVQARVNPARDGHDLTVQAGDVEGSVQGTRFDVILQGDAVGVKVHEGLVQVEDPHGTVMLGVGERWENDPHHEGCKEAGPDHRPRSTTQRNGAAAASTEAPGVDAPVEEAGQAGTAAAPVEAHQGPEILMGAGRLPNAGEAGAWEAPPVEGGDADVEPRISPEVTAEQTDGLQAEMVVGVDAATTVGEGSQVSEGAPNAPASAETPGVGGSGDGMDHPTCPAGDASASHLDVSEPGGSELGAPGMSIDPGGVPMGGLGPARSHLPPPLTEQVPPSRVSGPAHGRHASCACSLDHS